MASYKKLDRRKRGKGIAWRLLVIYTFISCSLICADYLNIPSVLGYNVDNMNWAFSLGIFANIIVVTLYVITYETLDKHTSEKEANKNKISEYLILQCYEQCLWWLSNLSDNVVEKHIVPEMDFNSTENKVVTNILNAPFQNENAIMNLINDGQVSLHSVQGYFKVKQLFSQYVTIRITFFDAPHLFDSVAFELDKVVKEEIRNLSIQMNE